MHVSATSVAASAARHLNYGRKAPQQATVEPTQQNAPSEGPAGAPDENIEPQPRSKEKWGRAHGVLRLLEAGHFKGVADVRLRINFHEELQKRSNDAAVERAVEGGAALVDRVEAGLTAVLGDATSVSDDAVLPDEVSGGLSAFESATRNAIDEAVSAGSVDTASFEATLRGAFDALVAALSPEVDENASAAFNATAVPDESLEAPDEGVASPLAELIGAFERGLSALLDEIAGASALPDPAPPRGSGVAYERFLAQYEQLTSGTTGQVDVAA